MATTRSKTLVGLGMMALLTSTAAVAQDLPSWLTERRIIGQNDLEPIENALNTEAYEQTKIVARVETIDGQGFCTSSRVGENLFLTNFHCFEFAACDNLQFHLGYERDLGEQDQLLYKCKEVLAKNELFDYALYRVEYVGPVGGSGITQTHPFPDLDLDIPDNDPAGVTQSLDISQQGKLANIKVRIKLTHAHVRDLKIEIISPSGTKVTLLRGDRGEARDLDRVFTLNEGMRVFLGEEVSGTWQLQVADYTAQDAGVLKHVDMIVTTADDEAVAREDRGPADYPIATLWAGNIDVDQLLIVASHPAARLKEIDRSATCKVRTIEPEEVSGRKTITHTCDTEGGSSGSPIVDRATGQIVALHWGGTSEYNLMIPMNLVVEDIRANVSNEVLQELSIRE